MEIKLARFIIPFDSSIEKTSTLKTERNANVTFILYSKIYAAEKSNNKKIMKSLIEKTDIHSQSPKAQNATGKLTVE